jgi:hypothetical protein
MPTLSISCADHAFANGPTLSLKSSPYPVLVAIEGYSYSHINLARQHGQESLVDA